MCSTTDQALSVTVQSLIPQFSNNSIQAVFVDNRSNEGYTEDCNEDRNAVTECKKIASKCTIPSTLNTYTSNVDVSLDKSYDRTDTKSLNIQMKSSDSSFDGFKDFRVALDGEDDKLSLEGLNIDTSNSERNEHILCHDVENVNNVVFNVTPNTPNSKKNWAIESDTTETSGEETKLEVCPTNKYDICGLEIDEKSELIKLNDSEIEHEDQILNSSIVDCTLSSTNELGIVRIDTSSDKCIEISTIQTEGKKQKSSNNVRSQNFTSNVLIQPAFEINLEKLGNGKEKNLNNSDLANNEKEKTEHMMHEHQEKPGYSEDNNTVSICSSEMQSEFKKNNKKRHETSSTISSDHVKIHSTSFVTIPDNEIKRNKYSDYPSYDNSNFDKIEYEPNFRSNKECNLNCDVINKSSEYMSNDYLDRIKRNSIRNVNLRKGTHMLLENEFISHSSNFDDKIKTEYIDPLCPSPEYPDGHNEMNNDVLRPPFGHKDDAVSLVNETLNSGTFLSSLNLPFTSMYIRQKPINHTALQDTLEYRYPKSLPKSPNQKSQKWSRDSIMGNEIELTKNIDKKSFVLNRIENKRALFTNNDDLRGKLTLKNCPSKNMSNSILQDSFDEQSNVTHQEIEMGDASDLYGYNYGVQNRTTFVGQFEDPALHLNFIAQRKLMRYPRFQLEDIQEVKSQDEKSSYTETRNSYNC